MIEILESPKYLVAMKVFGKLTADDVKAAYNAVEDALKDHERISFFAEIEDSVGITVDGLLKDLTEGISHFGKMSKYYRAAVVTDKGWIATMARFEGLVFSSIDVRVFEPKERAKALGETGTAPKTGRCSCLGPLSADYERECIRLCGKWQGSRERC
jgi:hypothetical protein